MSKFMILITGDVEHNPFGDPEYFVQYLRDTYLEYNIHTEIVDEAGDGTILRRAAMDTGVDRKFYINDHCNHACDVIDGKIKCYNAGDLYEFDMTIDGFPVKQLRDRNVWLLSYKVFNDGEVPQRWGGSPDAEYQDNQLTPWLRSMGFTVERWTNSRTALVRRGKSMFEFVYG